MRSAQGIAPRACGTGRWLRRAHHTEEERDVELRQSHKSVAPGARGPCEPSPFLPPERGPRLLEGQLEMDQGAAALWGIEGQSRQGLSGHGQFCPPCLLAVTWAGKGTRDQSPELCLLLLLLEPPASQMYGAP